MKVVLFEDCVKVIKDNVFMILVYFVVVIIESYLDLEY